MHPSIKLKKKKKSPLRFVVGAEAPLSCRRPKAGSTLDKFPVIY